MMTGNIYKNLESLGIISKKILFTYYIKQKKSTIKIAKIIGCSHSAIIRYLVKYDIPIRSRSLACKGVKKPKWSYIRKSLQSKNKLNLFLSYHKKLTSKYLKLWNNITEINWAWIAGFWEGEGNVSPRYRQFSKNPEITISITQKDPSALNYVKKLLKTGNVYKYRNNEFTCHKFIITKTAISKLFIKKIIPYIKSNHRIRQIKKLEIK